MRRARAIAESIDIQHQLPGHPMPGHDELVARALVLIRAHERRRRLERLAYRLGPALTALVAGLAMICVAAVVL